MKICGIYKIENLINHKVYIGQSVNIQKRWEGHKKLLQQNRHACCYLQNAWNKYGEINFSFCVVEECCKEDLVIREQYWIDYYGGIKSPHTYNSREAGSSGTFSEEVIERLRISHLGKNKGKPVPGFQNINRNDPEYRRKLSASLKGKKKSCLHAQHISEGRIGIQFSEEHKRNISKGKRGFSTSLKGRKKFEKNGIIKWIKPEEFQQYINDGWQEYHRFETGSWERGESSWNKGVPCSEEQKKRLREINLGKKLSEETKKRMSNSRKGMIWINNGVKNTRIKPKDFNKYEKLGWKKGKIRVN